ncbi:MAG: T9SS type A sorting domain-containing protein [Bacteroidota bacterium]
MRYLFTLSLIFSSFLLLTAQNNGGCGTVKPADFNLTSTYAERMDYIAGSSSRSAIRWVGVLYHIITKNDGTGGGSMKDIFDNHCELNTAYNDFNIGFYIVGFDTIKDTDLWEYQNSSLGWIAFQDYNVARVCNVYVNGNLPGLCGFATFPSGSSNRQGGIFLNRSCVGAGDQTYAHEMGHYLNLPHTFDDNSGIEFVNGSNCSSAGDEFCDTPADFLDGRTPCPYTGAQTDPNGDFYRDVIDETLIMSYFSDNCVNRFSNEQEAEMNGALTNRRSYLLNQPMPSTNTLDSAVFITPINGDTTVISSSVQFVWNAVPGAQYYVFRVQSSTSTVVIVDTLIAGTSYTISSLAPNKSYKFRVKAISFGNTCAENSPYQFIKTASIKTTLNVSTPSCPGSDDGSVFTSVSNGIAPYSFVWSNGATGAVLNDVPSGVYSVTITDNNGEIGIAFISITEPTPLSVNINQVGNNLNAEGNGGTAPYTYEWSNAVTGSGNNSITSGTYSVTITDAKGCTSTETFLISGTGIDLQTKVSMKVFPNPASQTAAINLHINLNERTDATVSIVNVTGEVIQQVKKEFVSGANTVSMNIEALASGVYFVQFTSKDITTTERVSVIK